MNAGAVNGYAVVWDAISLDFGARGQPPRYERIEKGALKIASNAIANTRHFAMAAFAFTTDSTLQFGYDDIGLWFRAVLPETMAGYGISNSLVGGKSIGASVELAEVAWHYDEHSQVEIVTSALVTGIALVESPVFPQARAWPDGDVPNDPQARALHSYFAARNRREPKPLLAAKAAAPRRPAYRPEPMTIPPMPTAMRRAVSMGISFDAYSLCRRAPQVDKCRQLFASGARR
jgi:phage head maturation protease